VEYKINPSDDFTTTTEILEVHNNYERILKFENLQKKAKEYIKI
jgi:hypothetical protein